MSSDIHIFAEYSPGNGKNVFSIRGTGSRYTSMYNWLNGPKCSARSIHNDMPWDHIVFDDPFDEQSFLVIYEDDLTFSTDTTDPYRPIPHVVHRMNVVPEAERVVGQSYMENCGHYHVWNPKPEGWCLQDEVMKMMADEIAKELDNEILEQLLNHAKK